MDAPLPFFCWLAAQPGAMTAWAYFTARRDAGLADDAQRLAAQLVRRWASCTPRTKRFSLIAGGATHG